MVYRSSMPNDANGREMSCPYCGTKNDRDRPTCWSCGKPLKTGVARQPATAGKKAVIAVEMPMSYTVLTVFAYIDVILGLVCCITFYGLAVGLPMIGSGLLLFALLGIWSAVERSAVYLRKIAEND